MEPLISVIVPVYKVEKYLHQCVDSILNQTCQNLEVILVDDGSPDNCGAICDEYARKDPRIRVIHTENVGQASARNTGLGYASGDYVTFVDSDDWVDSELYETIMRKAPFPVAVFGVTMDRPDGDQKKVLKACEESVLIQPDKDGDDLCKLAEASLLGYACNKIYSKDVLKHKVFPDAKLREDLLFNLDVLKNVSEIQLMNVEGYHYVQHESSTLHGAYLGPVPDIASVAEKMILIHPLLPRALNRKTASHLMKTYLCDALRKFVFCNKALSEADAVEEIRKVFSCRVIRRALTVNTGENKLFVMLTVCAKIQAARVFYGVVKRLWHE